MCRRRSARNSKCCAPTRPPSSLTSKPAAAVARSGSRCPPGASTSATCRCRCGRATAAANKRGDATSVVWRRGRRGVRHRTLRALLARVLDHLLALRGGGVAPLLAQHLAAFGRQLLKAVKVLAHACLLVRRQCLEPLPAPAQRVALLGGQRVPARETLACLVALRGRHAEPALAAVCQGLLPLGGEPVPLAAVARQEPLLILRKTRPCHARWRGRGSGLRLLGHRRRERGGRYAEQHGKRQRTPSVIHCWSFRQPGASAAALAGTVARAAAGTAVVRALRPSSRRIFRPAGPAARGNRDSPRPSGRRCREIPGSQRRGLSPPCGRRRPV